MRTQKSIESGSMISFVGNTALKIAEECSEEPTLTLNIAEEFWEPVMFDEELPELPTQLLSTVRVNGCPMHFEAYLVNGDGEIHDLKQQWALGTMKHALGDNETWSTIRYHNREYAVIALPFGKST